VIGKQASTVVSIIAVVALLLGYWSAGLTPFRFEVPKYVANQAERTEDGGLIFPGPGIARTEAAPAWLSALQEASRFQLILAARTDDPVQSGPARLLSISENTAVRNLTLGQEGADLILRFRRPGSTENGTPAYEARGVFADANWHAIVVEARPDHLRLLVDGRVHAEEAFAGDLFDDWRSDFPLVLGNEIPYGRHWVGEIRTAVLRIDGLAIDCLDPHSAQIPSGWLELRRLDVWAFDSGDWYKTLDVYVNFLGFVPFGVALVALSRGRRSVLQITAYGALLSLSIESLQILLPARHPSLSDLLLNTIGAAVGAYLARHLVASKIRQPAKTHTP